MLQATLRSPATCHPERAATASSSRRWFSVVWESVLTLREMPTRFMAAFAAEGHHHTLAHTEYTSSAKNLGLKQLGNLEGQQVGFSV